MVISAKKVNHAKVLEEKVLGSDTRTLSITDISIQGIILKDLSGLEKKCSELQSDFSEGDGLFVITPAKFVNGNIEFNTIRL